jgi:hypothetical protein
MADMCPRSLARVFTDATVGGGPDGTGAVGEMCASSNTAPTRNLARCLGCGSEQLVSQIPDPCHVRM